MRARLVPTVLAFGLLSAFLAAPAVAAAPPSVASTEAFTVAREHQRVVRYWTADRMRKARPREGITVQRASSTAEPIIGAPAGSGIVTGASWTRGGLVERTTGKVFFSMGSGNWVCSGSVVSDSVTQRSVVITAGHCVYDVDANVWASDWTFVPDYDAAATGDCATTAYGCWTATALVAHRQYTTAGAYNNQALEHDWAFAVVGAGGRTGTAQLDDVVESQEISFSRIPSGRWVHAFGYPATAPYGGDDLVHCKGPVTSDAMTEGATYGLGCYMTGGSSGGPWLSGLNRETGVGTVVSVNSYKYADDPSRMYGPVLGYKAEATFTAALTVSRNTSVNAG
jgi:V8-like Glu-specific endopeptidase